MAAAESQTYCPGSYLAEAAAAHPRAAVGAAAATGVPAADLVVEEATGVDLAAAAMQAVAEQEEVGDQIADLRFRISDLISDQLGIDKMQHQFSAIIDDLRSTHGKNLVSVTLYGSAAAGDFTPRYSDYNLLVALDKITPKDLRQAHACVREWRKMGHPVPVYFTVSELKNAADVFPIEFHQLQVAHKVLYGKDVLSGLKVSDRFLRHQAEYELRSKLLLLRRQYIPASTSVEGLVKLMAESLSSFSAVFRAVLILNGVRPPVKKHEIVALTVQKLGLDGSAFEKIFNIREDNFEPALDEAGANRLFGEYMEQIENVIDSVNAAGN